MESKVDTLVNDIVHGKLLANLESWLIFAGVVFLVNCIAGFVVSYFKKRGENYATRRDIQEITEKVEQIKSELQARHTLRFAALEKRLQTHQDAFRLLRKILFHVQQPDKLQDAIEECAVWYDENVLYLETEAQKAFWTAYIAATDLAMLSGQQPRDANAYKSSWKEIRDAIQTIASVVGLPSLKGDAGLSSP